ncbi:hypothetical protein HIM_10264 [Hirsutella minnesotensis 3608]|uniref:Cytochrome P450 n=1 Tax=Hirsutella minnesotensis 3608 TaxID=1043627 RepID=A0A0F7ZK95_9HYPO|nr:hypothetical protein HIM_10264 [Hirsutella minnesotensis 3608]
MPAFDEDGLHAFSKVLQHDLTRNIVNTEQVALQEAEHVMEQILVETDSWQEINLTAVLEKVMYQVSQRAYVGLALCRDDGYMENVKGYTRSLGMAMGFVGSLTPWPLRTITGVLAGLPVYWYLLRLQWRLGPVFKDRMERLRMRQREREGMLNDEPEDLITWMSRAVLSGVGPKSVTPNGMVTWLGILAILPTDNLVAGCTNSFLDLASSDPKHGYFRTIRDEANAAFGMNKASGQPISHALNHIDSALRESLRMNSLSSRALHRQVACAGGIVLPDGHRVPRGTWLCIPSGDIQSDDDSYEEARSFKPFRWVPKLIESSDAGKGPTLPLTSEKYLVFGHGRHACPGRWFSFHVMKVVMAYFVANYDIEPLERRPPNAIVGDINLPPMSPIIRIKKLVPLND